MLETTKTSYVDIKKDCTLNTCFSRKVTRNQEIVLAPQEMKILIDVV